MLLKHTHIVVESGWATNKQSEQQLRNYSKMKVYGAISSSLAEDAPLLLHNTQDEKKPPLFKGALTASSRKTIALAVAGVAACGAAVAIVAKGSGNGVSAPIGAFRLGDALEDAKAGKKDFCSNLISLV